MTELKTTYFQEIISFPEVLSKFLGHQTIYIVQIDHLWTDELDNDDCTVGCTASQNIHRTFAVRKCQWLHESIKTELKDIICCTTGQWLCSAMLKSKCCRNYQDRIKNEDENMQLKSLPVKIKLDFTK